MKQEGGNVCCQQPQPPCSVMLTSRNREYLLETYLDLKCLQREVSWPTHSQNWEWRKTVPQMLLAKVIGPIPLVHNYFLYSILVVFVMLSSVQFSSSIMSDSLWPHGLQHARLPCPSPTRSTCLNSCPLSWWCHLTISFSVFPFSSCLLSFIALGSFRMSQFFSSGGQSIGVSALASVLPMNIQDWFTLQLTVKISLQSKGLSRAFSNTTFQKHQFFGTQLSL